MLPNGNHPNNGGVVSVYLKRGIDDSIIPYVTVRGVSLIAMLRMKLVPEHRTRTYHQFVQLPLFQDMAPWNIVFNGVRNILSCIQCRWCTVFIATPLGAWTRVCVWRRLVSLVLVLDGDHFRDFVRVFSCFLVQGALEYIDYDTKDHTYDAYVKKIFETMEVLFNYKRTLEDLKRCGPKAKVLYGFPFVSDCVGSSYIGPCKNNSLPVPCGDGTCRSDFVDCLRAMSLLEIKPKEPEVLAVADTTAEGVVDGASAPVPQGSGGGVSGKTVLAFGSSGKMAKLPDEAVGKDKDKKP